MRAARSGHRARQGASHALNRVRQAARLKKEERFTALLHHVDVSASIGLRRRMGPFADKVAYLLMTGVSS